MAAGVPGRLVTLVKLKQEGALLPQALPAVTQI
jgi:hypothetical protein